MATTQAISGTIHKFEAAGLERVVDDVERAKRKEKSKARKQAKLARERELIAAFRAGKAEALRTQPHPKNREGATAWDYVAWCVENHFVGETTLRLIESVI